MAPQLRAVEVEFEKHTVPLEGWASAGNDAQLRAIAAVYDGAQYMKEIVITRKSLEVTTCLKSLGGLESFFNHVHARYEARTSYWTAG